MERKIIRIDAALCNGCGLCVDACHEGAIGMVDGKAVLLRDDYCDGLGDCLPTCPTGAISFEVRKAAPFDAEAVKAHMAARAAQKAKQAEEPAAGDSQLRNFPVQLRLVAPNAAFLNGADLLVAADCAAYTHGDFHRQFMKDKVTLIGCPKLDEANYAAKLALLLRENDIHSLTLVRMQVPCCGGLERAARQAVDACGKDIPFEVITLSTTGEVVK